MQKKNNTAKKSLKKSLSRRRDNLSVRTDKVDLSFRNDSPTSLRRDKVPIGTKTLPQISDEVIAAQVPQISANPEAVRQISGKPRSVTVPIIGTVGDDGVKLFAERHPMAETDEKRAKTEAKVIADFLEGGPPDFLMRATLDALDRAWEHVFGEPHDHYQDYDAENLRPLCVKTKLISWDQMWPDEDETKPLESITATLPNGEELELYGDAADMAKQRGDTDPAWIRLANAVAEIASNDAAPSALQESVIDFLSSNSGDLWGKLMITPPMIQKILIGARIKDEMAEEVAQ